MRASGEVGSGHLRLGILRDGRGGAAAALAAVGVEFRAVRGRVVHGLRNAAGVCEERRRGRKGAAPEERVPALTFAEAHSAFQAEGLGRS